MQNDTLKTAAVNAESLTNLGVAAAAAAIKSGELSSETYAGALLENARKEADLHSFITIDEAAVLSAARDADKARAAGSQAPLLGVPLGIKDSYLTKGLRTTIGVKTLAGFVPDKDADIVAAVKNAGGIVFGKNNLVELSYGLTGNNETYGQAKNPHNRDHVTGGSSSGAGASVAARIVPAALGGDTVGSIRVPASFCGVVGFKPTTGRWVRNGVAPISHMLDTTGVLARTVEDCALIDGIVTNTDAAETSLRSDLKGIKLAYAPRQYLELVDPDVEANFNSTLARLREAGAELVEVDLGENFSLFSERATWSIFFHDTMKALSDFLQQNEVPATFESIYNDLKPDLKEAWGYLVLPNGAGAVSPDTYKESMFVDRAEIERSFAKTFARHDAVGLILPTTPTTAPSIEHQYKFMIGDQEVTYAALAKNTVPASLAGLPGISVPTGLARNGLPIGLEIDGPHGSDRRLLDVARRIEAVVGSLKTSA